MQNRLPDLRRPALLLALLIAALWPHWMWMAKRMQDGSDEPWGIVALLAVIATVVVDHKQIRGRLSAATLAGATMLAVAAALAIDQLPAIVAAALAMLAVAVMLVDMLPADRPLLPLAAMLLLALPLAASLNFYLGYPSRWLCAHGAAWLLGVLGLQASAEGAALLWNGKTVLVDAPCAGIAMLWIGLFSAALLSYLYRAGAIRFAGNLAAAAAIVLVGNVVRNTVLFFKEAGIAELPNWTHDAIGLLLFAGSFLALHAIVSWRPYAR